jgi:hydrogenase maturation factor
LGEVPRRRLVVASGARPGDAILLTKGIAIEATAIMAREKASELSHTFEPAFLERCKGFLMNPGISVVKDARIACQGGEVHAMHDPTEGGLANGLWEMAQAAGVGLMLDAECVPIYEETLALCQVMGLAPWGLIASGALLLSVEAADAEQVLDALKAEGIEAANIGLVTEAANGIGVRQAMGVVGDLPRFDRDEIARLFE